MFKLLLTSSENNTNFGVTKVVQSLNKEFKKKKIQSIYSNNILKLITFKPNLIHINGCWKLKLIFFFLLAKFFRMKIVISPHGMLDPVSLNQKKIRKRIALILYQRFIVNNSDLIIVNSKFEKKNLLKFTKRTQKIIVINHGIIFDKKFKVRSNNFDNLKFVFFSRIHKSKNLHTLVRIWRNHIFFEKFNLDIYGQVQDHKYFSNLKIDNDINIKYLGPLNSKIQTKLSKYDVLIHPSKSENFGLVIFEALSSGLFLILNKKIKKDFLAKKKFSKNINFNSKELINAIKYILRKKKEIKNLSYKKKLFLFVKKNFDWKEITNIYCENYKNLLDI